MPESTEDNARKGKKKLIPLFAVIVVILLYCLFGGHTPGTVRKMTAEDFKKSRAGQAVLVAYFTAEWCGPCQTQGPIVDKFASRFKRGVVVGKIDVDAEPGLTNSLDINSIPKIIVFKNGREAARFRGVTEEAELAGTVENLL